MLLKPNLPLQFHRVWSSSFRIELVLNNILTLILQFSYPLLLSIVELGALHGMVECQNQFNR